MLFSLFLLFFGISFPLIFAGYIIVRSRKLLGVGFFRKSFWFGVFLPMAYLVLMITLHKLLPDIYNSLNILNTDTILISSHHIVNIVIFLILALIPWWLIGAISIFRSSRECCSALMTYIATSIFFLVLVVLLLPILHNTHIFISSIALWSIIVTFLNALSEESNKVIFARTIGWDSVVWIVLGGIIIALGFAFCENIFYALITYSQNSSLVQVGNLLFVRTFFSLGIHMVSMFLALGFFFDIPKKLYFFHPRIVLWFLCAIVFHTLSNIFLESENSFFFLLLWIILFFGISFGLYRLEKILGQKSDSIWQATL